MSVFLRSTHKEARKSTVFRDLLVELRNCSPADQPTQNVPPQPRRHDKDMKCIANLTFACSMRAVVLGFFEAFQFETVDQLSTGSVLCTSSFLLRQTGNQASTYSYNSTTQQQKSPQSFCRHVFSSCCFCFVAASDMPTSCSCSSPSSAALVTGSASNLSIASWGLLLA